MHYFRCPTQSLCQTLALSFCLLACCQSLADTFISEIHYDNASTDQNEAVEISSDLDTDLSSWRLVLYNGANGSTYNSVALPIQANSDPSCGDNGGTIVINFPTNGIQNGAPDGLALVDGSEVVQFLSYEGTFTASNGPASGIESTDIGQSETSATAANESLQLVNGIWSPPQESTFGTCTTVIDDSVPPAPAGLFLSEIHYDNRGADVDEGIELTGPVGADVNGWQVALYNGSNGEVYRTIDLSGELQTADGCTTGTFVERISGLQNGSPDGVALIDPSGEVREFISYEGSLTASTGPAAGMTSDDIGVAEASDTAIGDSLQLFNGVWSGPTENTFGICEGAVSDPEFVKIHDIQGSGARAAINGPVIVEAVVTADYQGENQLRGFFLQEEDADNDADPATSEGIFVFCGSCEVDVALGDLLRVTGEALDFFEMTQISIANSNDIEILGRDTELPSPVSLKLPLDSGATDIAGAQASINAIYESFEGMLVHFDTALSVAEYFNLGRFGEIVLTANGRPRTFTDAQFPSEEGLIAHQIDLAERRIVLDDDNNRQNVANDGGVPVYFPQPGLSIDNFFRGGDTISDLSGVLHWSWAGSSGTESWRVRPIPSLYDYRFVSENPRSEAPAPTGGKLKVASFNVLNYFTTLDTGDNACGPDGSAGCRGANSITELARQTQKVVNTICAIDADIIGLMELENPRLGEIDAAINQLVTAINEQCPNYAAIETGTVGSDAITVGVIYRPEYVSPTGLTAILDDASFTDPNNSGRGKNRPAIAQSFLDLSSERVLTVVVNHLKSKGSRCGEGDDDPLRGQASCNLTRTLAAQRQAQWLSTNPTQVWNNDHVLIIGDMNAYRNEDPIIAFKNAGFTDAIDFFNGPEAYGYVFDGQLGYLDHALVNDNLLPLITGVSDWHINADEINLFDYNDSIRDAGEAAFEVKPPLLPLFSPAPYRSSDHDPLVVGIEFPSIELCHGQEPSIYVQDGLIVGGTLDGRTFNGVLLGSKGDDVILGSREDDIIYAGAGNDLVCAGEGKDRVLSGSGKDIVSAGSGDDITFGGTDTDVLYGDDGYDVILGGGGADQCEGEKRVSCEK